MDRTLPDRARLAGRLVCLIRSRIGFRPFWWGFEAFGLAAAITPIFIASISPGGLDLYITSAFRSVEHLCTLIKNPVSQAKLTRFLIQDLHSGHRRGWVGIVMHSAARNGCSRANGLPGRTRAVHTICPPRRSRSSRAETGIDHEQRGQPPVSGGIRPRGRDLPGRHSTGGRGRSSGPTNRDRR